MSADRRRHRPVSLVVAAGADGEEIRGELRLPRSRGVLVLNGGTEELPRATSTRLRALLRDGLAPVAREKRVTAVTGGTDAGVFKLFGAALGSKPTAPVIGIAPADLVETPGAGPGGDGATPLEPHHTHVVLVQGDEWGDETPAMLSLVEALSADAPSVAVLAGGGEVAKREVLGHVRAEREVIVLEGSGRLADEIAAALAAPGAVEDDELREIAAGRITVFDRRAVASQLADLVAERFAPRRRPTLRSIPLLSVLPRLRWRSPKERPFVEPGAVARWPDLRGEVALLEQELMPRFHVLDRDALRAQNSFRLSQLFVIFGSAVASALGAVQTALGGGVAGVAIPEAVIAGLLSGTLVYIRGRDAQREYLTKRLQAERLRSEYFLFLARAAAYAGRSDGDRLALLRERARAIELNRDAS
jgi:TRPM family ion channel/uncharacterized protein DUF4231